MNLEQIKSAVNNGKHVFWASRNYQVVVDGKGQWFIKCHSNNTYLGLTNFEGKLNALESDFFAD